MISILCAILATTQVYRLELTEETPYIVGQDGVKRQVCIVDPSEYAIMTGRVDQVWRSLNSTDSGRTQLHGKRTEQIIDSTNGIKVTVYNDGYRYSEPFVARTTENISAFAGRKKTVHEKTVQAVRNKHISERHQKMREAIEARKKQQPKIITVEHDAATGKDEVK